MASKMVTEWTWCIGQVPQTNLLRSVALIFAWFKAMCPKLHCFSTMGCFCILNLKVQKMWDRYMPTLGQSHIFVICCMEGRHNLHLAFNFRYSHAINLRLVVDCLHSQKQRNRQQHRQKREKPKTFRENVATLGRWFVLGFHLYACKELDSTMLRAVTLHPVFCFSLE